MLMEPLIMRDPAKESLPFVYLYFLHPNVSVAPRVKLVDGNEQDDDVKMIEMALRNDDKHKIWSIYTLSSKLSSYILSCIFGMEKTI